MNVTRWRISSLFTLHATFGFMFDTHITFSDQVSSLWRSGYSHISKLCCIRH